MFLNVKCERVCVKPILNLFEGVCKTCNLRVTVFYTISRVTGGLFHEMLVTVSAKPLCNVYSNKVLRNPYCASWSFLLIR